nr:phosphoadenosine phosphosulfate reductase family protein [Candidatus Brocadiales bacterium]
MPKKKVRHILGLSGGKDSAALALYLRDRIPDIEYFFCDTGCELTETYEFLNKLEARLHRTIKRLKSRFTFDQWLLRYDGFLPSAISRWCTVQLKIVPLEEFVGDDEAISYIGIRADEKRDGYISSKDNINPVYPFQEDGLIKEDIINILNDEGVGLPKYYEWRSRSGCYFCFFQRKIEWIRLS